MFGEIQPDDDNTSHLRQQFQKLAAEWQRDANCAPSSSECKLARDEIEYCDRLFSELDLKGNGQLSRGGLVVALRKMGLAEKVPEFSEPREGARWFRQFSQWAFDAHCIPGEGEEFISLENFRKLYEDIAKHWPDYMPVDREEAARKTREEIRDAAYAAKVVDEAAKQFELLNLDESAMLRIFHLFDADQSGYLESKEIRRIAREMKIPDYERDNYRGFIKRNARHVDDNGNGLIEFDEFKTLLQSLVTCKVDRAYRLCVLQKRPLAMTFQEPS
ncbi:hypothetical protein FOL47_010794 [Perkinsus chesapeaki]|uniref:EF-hand domain-containing protein n=1 Tax=Perkinsus chesapeaki TaxID=330153 RepID=A0A7J6L2N1_PERCH|nr:hypothetical protein FOL47_010794 [Perkinsus chesapeaki]